jgi:hypothetical protein
MAQHGKVETWYMSEEERQAYIKKHPIKPEQPSRGSTFASVNVAPSKQAIENRMRSRTKRLMQDVDKELLHQLFMDGEKLASIAKVCGISEATLHNHIKEQRKIEPERWPHRQERRK